MNENLAYEQEQDTRKTSVTELAHVRSEGVRGEI
jgi:hypothetical protein